jgi:hypothetical protein
MGTWPYLGMTSKRVRFDFNSPTLNTDRSIFIHEQTSMLLNMLLIMPSVRIYALPKKNNPISYVSYFTGWFAVSYRYALLAPVC